MVTDLVQIRRLGEKKRPENERFRKHLKSRNNWVERRFRIIAGQVADAIDCTSCGNCCREATVKVVYRDIERLARFVGMKPREFTDLHVVESPEEGHILRRTAEGCPFLVGNTCSVYPARPGACQDFPHLTSNDGSLVSRMWQMPDRATYCPIVYNTLEVYKDESNFIRS